MIKKLKHDCFHVTLKITPLLTGKVALFYDKFIDTTLHDSESITTWHFHGCSNACKCMPTLFSTTLSFLSVCMSQHGIRTGLSNVKRLNAIQTGKH